MTLTEILLKFRSMSGRFDLVSAAGADSGYPGVTEGGLYYIRAAQRFLDRRIDLQSETQIEEVSVDGTTYAFLLSSYTEIFNIIPKDGDGVYYEELKRLEYAEFRDSFPDRANESPGTPAYYTIQPRGSSTLSTLAAAISALETSTTVDVIIVGPVPDGSYTLEIAARISLAELSDGDDTNGWTVLYPDTLLKAAMYELEVTYRNTEGQKDWLLAIEKDLFEIDKIRAQIEDPGWKELQG